MDCRRRSAHVAAAAILLLAGCSGEDDAPVPDRLADGRPVEPRPVELEGVDEPVVVTAVQVTAASESRDAAAVRTCLARRPERLAPESPIVVRVTSRSVSVTVADDGRRTLVGCDGIPDSEEPGRIDWCGSASGMVFDGALRDPRLDLGCADARGAVGHLWIEPGPATAFVSVEQDGYLESYAVAADLPVRIATGDVELEGSRARAVVLEHGRGGRLIHRYRLEAAVAG